MITKPKSKNIIFQVVLPKADNTIAYNMTKSVMRNEDIGEYIAYGICVTMNGILFDEIRDVATTPATVQALVDKCNQLSLSTKHFRDVVEDFVAGELY